MTEIIELLENKRRHIESTIKVEKTKAKAKTDKNITKLTEKIDALNKELCDTFDEIDKRHAEELSTITLALSKLRD